VKGILFVVAFSLAVPLQGAEVPGVVVWEGATLKSYGRKLAPKMDAKKLASEPLGSFGNHVALIGHRQADGEAEIHEAQADVFVVQDGEATLVVGGELTGGRTIAPGELRGPSIKGGERKPLAVGDIVHIPARMPHQLLVAAGKEFTYFVLKVDAPKGADRP
jgi:mannose-6-phosphate isomerase-like protein (cupin superfamily)